MTGLINPSGSKILAEVLNKDLFVGGNEFMNDINHQVYKQDNPPVCPN